MPAERTVKVRLRTARRRRAGSARWLARQLNDPYVHQAKHEGYRSRAAYKLLEIDHKYRLLRPGLRVIDLGSAPGGWLQVAAGRGCRVVGLDLEPIAPIDGAVALEGDVFDPASAARLKETLGATAQLVLSDLAARATGQRAVDRLRAEALGEAVLALVPELLAPGGHALIKLVKGAEADVVAEARRSFAKVKLVRPDATRRESSEIYLLGLGYRGRSPAPAGPSDQRPPPDR